jgi:hypothetical protein
MCWKAFELHVKNAKENLSITVDIKKICKISHEERKKSRATKTRKIFLWIFISSLNSDSCSAFSLFLAGTASIYISFNYVISKRMERNVNKYVNFRQENIFIKQRQIYRSGIFSSSVAVSVMLELWSLVHYKMYKNNRNFNWMSISF